MEGHRAVDVVCALPYNLSVIQPTPSSYVGAGKPMPHVLGVCYLVKTTAYSAFESTGNQTEGTKLVHYGTSTAVPPLTAGNGSDGVTWGLLYKTFYSMP